MKLHHLPAIGIALMASGSALAQTAAEPAPGVQGSNDDIVVTARKVAENVQSVPLSIVAFGGTALKNQTIQSLRDIQAQTPNLRLLPSAADPQSLLLSIRGQRQNDLPPTVDPSVGIYIDGVYHPRSVGLAGAMIDLNRVEVLRGPQGTLYGRNTTGGALAVYSNDPTNELEGSVSGTYGNYDAWNLEGVLNVPVSDNVAARFVAQRGKHDPYGHAANGDKLAFEDSTYLRGKVKAEFGAVTALVSGTYQKNHAGGGILKVSELVPAANGMPEGGVATLEAAAELGLPFTPEGLAQAAEVLKTYINDDHYHTDGNAPNRSDFEGYSGSLDLKAKLTDDITVRSITGYEHYDRQSSQDVDGTPFSSVPVAYRTRGRYLSEELQLLGGDKNFNWVTGVYFGDEKARQFETADILAFLTPPGGNPFSSRARIRNKSIAVFGQATWEFADGWRLTGGARYSRDRRIMISSNVSGSCSVPAPGVPVTDDPTNPLNGPSQCPRKFSKAFAKPSWLASIDHQLTSNILAYGKIAYGFRTGGQNLRASKIAETFEPFGPETVLEYEVGVKADIVPNVIRVNLAAFHDIYKGAQRSIIIAGPGNIPIGVVSNAASGRVNGFEAEFRVRPIPELTFNAGLGYVDAKYKKFIDLTGDRSNETFGVPKWTGSISGNFTKPTNFGSVTAQVDYSWQSKVVLEPSARIIVKGVTQDGYGLVNARIGATIASVDLDVALFGKNLTKKFYAVAANANESLGFNNLTTGNPRTYGVTVTKRF